MHVTDKVRHTECHMHVDTCSVSSDNASSVCAIPLVLKCLRPR